MIMNALALFYVDTIIASFHLNQKLIVAMILHQVKYSLGQKKGPTFKYWSLVKNLPFFPFLMRLGENNNLKRLLFSPSFMRIGQKNEDFLLMASFLTWALFLTQTLVNQSPRLKHMSKLRCKNNNNQTQVHEQG